ncbi:MAG: hypothetical protein HW414_1766 [Dehalococcoidia bacterium]|nr:hypothetical protein [Dehalococcoidia bacterium]
MMADIERRIGRLLRQIARSNELPEAVGKQVGDYLRFGSEFRRIVSISGASRVGGDTYFLLDLEAEDLSEICIELSKTNPGIVSPEDVQRRVRELISEMKANRWRGEGVSRRIRQIVRTVTEYGGRRATVTVPVWGLDVGGSPLVVGDVEFKSRPFSDKVEDELKYVDPNGLGVHAIAVTSCAGDEGMIFANARTQVNRAMNILRAFSFPVARNDYLQEIAIEGDLRSLQSFGLLTYPENKEPGIYLTATHVHLGGVMPLNIPQSLPIMNAVGFSEFLEAVRRPNRLTKMIAKAVDWLGEATKPDVLPAKFVKVAFSIDAMVGAEGQNLPDSGKRIRIADRAAFLMGRSYKSRNMVWRAMDKIIGKRDKIAHGSSEVLVTEADVEEAGKYARGLLHTLLLGPTKFKEPEELAAWAKRQALLG